MAKGHRTNSQAPPEASGVFFLPEMVNELGAPVLARFASRLRDGEAARILAAVAKVPRRNADVSREAVQEIICRELLGRMLADRVREGGLSPDEVARDLARARWQLDGLGERSRPRRVYYTVSALHRCATQAQEREVIAASCRALEMSRNQVDVYKGRALQRLAANTCFVQGEGETARELLGEIHLFFLDMEPPLRASASALLETHCRPGSSAGSARTVAAHLERNRRRKVYEQRRKQAKQLWTAQLPEALDASSMRPIDAEAELLTELCAPGLSPAEVAERVNVRWRALRIGDSIPKRFLPTTTWQRIFTGADRPPTWVLEGEWQHLLRGRGLIVEDAWRLLVDAARAADAAHAEWVHASEHALAATQDDPAALKAAIEQFNRSLDEVLTRSARSRASR